MHYNVYEYGTLPFRQWVICGVIYCYFERWQINFAKIKTMSYKILTDFLDKLPSNKKYKDLKMIEAIELNEIRNESCLDTMKLMPDNFVDLTITSPPYDDLRNYNGYSFDFESIAKELYRVTKQGGVVVWVVGDKTHKGSETGTSFKQALYFKECGFNLHDTMIWKKINPMPVNDKRYQQSFEYMFVFSKGSPSSVNLIKEEKTKGTIERQKTKIKTSQYGKDGEYVNYTFYNGNVKTSTKKKNIFEYKIGFCSKGDKTKHPAIFPEQLANDHIISWSNESDLVYDPFMGSGTTAKMAILNNRNYIGSEISIEYCDIIAERLARVEGKKNNCI
jgi:site-specific DNA-methyltransferase (adenine-specific)